MRQNYSKGIQVAHKLQAGMNMVRICCLISNNYGFHCRSIWCYMDLCQIISTDDKESSEAWSISLYVFDDESP